MPRYAKGFQIDRKKIAQQCHLNGTSDPEVDHYIVGVVDLLNRGGYKYIDCGYKHDGTSGGLNLIIVLAVMIFRSSPHRHQGALI